MPLLNPEIADHFQETADLLELLGANPFRVRAYRNAARVVGDLGEPLHKGVDRGDNLTEIPSIGKDLASQIEELVKTGTTDEIEELRQQVPPELPDLLRLPGLGPKKVAALWHDLEVTSLDELRQAAEAEQIRGLKGFGQKTEANILKALAAELSQERRFLRAQAAPYAEMLRDHLAAMAEVERVEIAGSYRRGRETVGDIDLLVAASNGNQAIMDAFVEHEAVRETLAHGRTKSSVVLRNGLQVDLRVVAPNSFGAALHYFTGSKDHNVAVRRMAQERGLTVNEYGVHDDEGRQVAGATEQDVYATVDLPYIAPHLREDRGEFAAARAGKLPTPIEPGDYRGNLHTHTTWSDGRLSLRDMVDAARERGYAYLAISDHSQRLTVANGLDAKRLRQQMAEIDKLNDELGDGFRILKSIECDVLEDGSLDLDDEVLGELDLLILAIHSQFRLPREQQTARLLKAMDHPRATFVAHPTGRLLSKRAGYELDVARLIEHAAERGVWLEINAHPVRLDLDDVHARQAKEAGVKITVNTDAHTAADLDNLPHGLMQANRAWLQRHDVVNCLPLDELLKAIQATRLD